MGFHTQKICSVIAAGLRLSTFFSENNFSKVNIIFCQNLQKIIGSHRNFVLGILRGAFVRVLSLCVLTFLLKETDPFFHFYP